MCQPEDQSANGCSLAMVQPRGHEVVVDDAAEDNLFHRKRCIHIIMYMISSHQRNIFLSISITHVKIYILGFGSSRADVAEDRWV